MNSSTISLNVGGTKFCSTKSTLCSKSKYFEHLLSGQFSEMSVDANDEIFIDRDPASFSVILSWMRTGIVRRKGLDETQLEVLVDDAHFYQCEALLRALIPSGGDDLFVCTLRAKENMTSSPILYLKSVAHIVCAAHMDGTLNVFRLEHTGGWQCILSDKLESIDGIHIDQCESNTDQLLNVFLLYWSGSTLCVRGGLHGINPAANRQDWDLKTVELDELSHTPEEMNDELKERLSNLDIEMATMVAMSYPNPQMVVLTVGGVCFKNTCLKESVFNRLILPSRGTFICARTIDPLLFVAFEQEILEIWYDTNPNSQRHLQSRECYKVEKERKITCMDTAMVVTQNSSHVHAAVGLSNGVVNICHKWMEEDTFSHLMSVFTPTNVPPLEVHLLSEFNMKSVFLHVCLGTTVRSWVYKVQRESMHSQVGFFEPLGTLEVLGDGSGSMALCRDGEERLALPMRILSGVRVRSTLKELHHQPIEKSEVSIMCLEVGVPRSLTYGHRLFDLNRERMDSVPGPPAQLTTIRCVSAASVQRRECICVESSSSDSVSVAAGVCTCGVRVCTCGSVCRCDSPHVQCASDAVYVVQRVDVNYQRQWQWWARPFLVTSHGNGSLCVWNLSPLNRSRSKVNATETST